MNRTKYLKGECSHCGGHLEFPAEAIGMPTDCPHCGNQTELMLTRPPEEPSVPRKAIVWAVMALLILGLGLGGAFAALKRAQRMAAARQKERAAATAPAVTNLAPPEDPAAKAGFRISAITLEKTPGTSLVHAVGTITNPLAKLRFGVRVQLDLFDAAGQKVGTANDYQQLIEPNSQWRFHAVVVHSKAVSARLASITEEQ